MDGGGARPHDSTTRHVSRRKVVVGLAAGTVTAWVAPSVVGLAAEAAASSDPPVGSGGTTPPTTTDPQFNGQRSPDQGVSGDPGPTTTTEDPPGSTHDHLLTVDRGAGNGSRDPGSMPQLRRVVVLGTLRGAAVPSAVAFTWDRRTKRWSASAPDREDRAVLGVHQLRHWDLLARVLSCAGTASSCTVRVVGKRHAGSAPAVILSAYVVRDSRTHTPLLDPRFPGRLADDGTWARFDGRALV